ncbi:Superoxide dismutase [Cu-Zn] precursor [Polaromonas sp. CG9_12]|uniref:superoxide dismutase family protein n=1 Tax=Polaromonas sp. CG_9.11 TaxID=2787730 RepID=UPI0004DDDCE9|nr:superoxide dismutase family protein [Polaromonas sp. CG_9.11]MBG6075453.1 Cu-Zn family superoxide dismutase [Polaromonas sp. CG_9.11]CDS54242.1 Superoxide dismutase [Cu-Zn] precursor [Polaromonas sp. CG9_12]
MTRTFILLASLLALGACASTTTGPRAVAQLQSTAGNTASGSVTFIQSGDKVLVSGTVSGLKANAEHGFHLHEKGDCSSGDGMSAGGHFNPDGQPHGKHSGMTHHAGDLPSLKADASGVARFSFESKSISVGSGTGNIIGRGLIVHRDPDDYTTQPTGNSGPRLACAVVTPG